MEKLLANVASAKKKLVLGIVFTAVGLFLVWLGFALAMMGYAFGIVLMILALILSCVGTPFLIIGIVKTVKAKRRVALAKAAEARGEELPAAQEEALPVAEETAPAEEAPACEEAAPVEEIPDEAAPAEEAAPKAEGFVDIDWKKYEPLECGISYNPDKDYKFHRADGFVGSAPQTFVNRTFPKCPICCSKDPYWTIAQHNQMSWKGNLYLFKCSRCESIISMSMPDVTTLANGAGGIATNPTVGLTNLLVKSSSGKEAGAVYAVIESVGNSGVTAECQGREFKLEHLQDMFDRM